MTAAVIVAGSPLARAVFALDGRFRDLGPHKGFRLDGKPASAQTVIIAANEVLREQGYPLIAYPGVAGIHTRGTR